MYVVFQVCQVPATACSVHDDPGSHKRVLPDPQVCLQRDRDLHHQRAHAAHVHQPNHQRSRTFYHSGPE